MLSLSPGPVEQWAAGWYGRLQAARLNGLTLQRGFKPISETMSNWEYDSLWDVIFERHPKGPYYRGKFEQAGKPIPRSPSCRIFSASSIQH